MSTINEKNEKALSIQEAADILSVHKQTVWRLIRAGKIKAVYVSPGRRVILQSELNKYLGSL